MEKELQSPVIERKHENKAQEGKEAASEGKSMPAPPFQLKSGNGVAQAHAPVQMNEGKKKELREKTISLSSNSGVSDIYLKEQFKASPKYLTDETARLLKEIEGGKSVEDAAGELLSAVENHFISDKDSSTLDLLGEKKSGYYRKKDFHHMSYPGNPRNKKKARGKMKDFPVDKAKEVQKLERKARREKDKEKKAEIKKKIADILSAHPDLKKALADEGVARSMMYRLNKIRAERRANQGKTGVMTEKEFKARDKDEQQYIIEFFQAKMKPIPGEKGHKLYEDAMNSYVKMREQAKKDGVSLKLQDADRPLSAARKAAKGGNRAAVASWSSHTLGLAIDLKLNVDGGKHGQETSTSPMNDVIKKRESSAHKWVFVKGARYGWYPYQNEPWHWEYNPKALRAKMLKELDAFIKAKKGETVPDEEKPEKAAPEAPSAGGPETSEAETPALPSPGFFPIDMMINWAMRLFNV